MYLSIHLNEEYSAMQITLVLTSCWRYDLLEKTISSIAQTIDLSLYPRILTEDSKDEVHLEKIRRAERDGFLKWWKVLYTMGSSQTDLYKCHYYALVELYRRVETKYVFHCEDDQIFQKTDFDYFRLSYDILESHPEIGIVQLRDLKKDFGLKKTWIMASRYYELLTDRSIVLFGHRFIYASDTNLFSLQPWLRRIAEMREIMFGYEDYVDERKVNERMRGLSLQSIVLDPWIFNHINPILHSTKNLKNLGIIVYTFSFLGWTIRYRSRLLVKYFAWIYKTLFKN